MHKKGRTREFRAARISFAGSHTYCVGIRTLAHIPGTTVKGIKHEDKVLPALALVLDCGEIPCGQAVGHIRHISYTNEGATTRVFLCSESKILQPRV